MACSDGSLPVAEITSTFMATVVTAQMFGSGTGRGGAGTGPRGEVGMTGGATGPRVRVSRFPPAHTGPTQVLRGPTVSWLLRVAVWFEPDARSQAQSTATAAIAKMTLGAFTKGLLVGRENWFVDKRRSSLDGQCQRPARRQVQTGDAASGIALGGEVADTAGVEPDLVRRGESGAGAVHDRAGDARPVAAHGVGHARSDVFQPQALDRQRRIPPELGEGHVEQIAEQRMRAVVRAQIRLVIHVRVEIALQH